MSRIIHFEINSDRPGEVADFYKNVFDWQITKWEGPTDYWLANTGNPDTPGINGAILKSNMSVNGTVNTIEVSDLDEYIERIEANKGEVISKKMPVPGVGFVAYCKDVSGTVFGIVQFDQTIC